ncbi:MCE family protein [Rhodococcus gannanensis]|uniref:MCE family protein n=1 Tax=Rhodococcus gannanensis TaxID=1960308 RepID=A0ABW4NYJ9_9NOCA
MRGRVVGVALFATVMLAVTAGLVVVFGEFRFQPTTGYRALFTDASGLHSGDPVRVFGLESGRVGDVSLTPEGAALVEFTVDTSALITDQATAAVRYQNLVGDRYLAVDPGSGVRPLDEGDTLPVERTSPALDLDELLGGFKPLFGVLAPEQVNALSAEVIALLQGQDGTVESVLAHTASITTTLADRDVVIGRVIDNLDTTVAALAGRRDTLAVALDRAADLSRGLAEERQTWGSALDHIDTAAADVAALMEEARAPLQGTVTELGRTAAQLDSGRGTLDSVLSRLPETYAALSRLGVYGNFFNYYLCAMKVKYTGPDGADVTTPLFGQPTGRCAPR